MNQTGNPMKTLHYSIVIHAPKEKVWHTMLDDKTYREWTKAFNPTSSFKGDWSKGSKILFVGTDPNTREEGGMVSKIAENVPYELLSIEHLGILKNGVEDTTSAEAKEWTPAFETYTFKEVDGGTELMIDVDVVESMAQAFDSMWPPALQKLKELSEAL
jgi:uncharacterized protein YndB with AHSA1/START domain